MSKDATAIPCFRSYFPSLEFRTHAQRATSTVHGTVTILALAICFHSEQATLGEERKCLCKMNVQLHVFTMVVNDQERLSWAPSTHPCAFPG